MDDLLLKLANPARRALQTAGITTLEQLSSFTADEILALHGIGKNALRVIQAVLAENGMALRNAAEKAGE